MRTNCPIAGIHMQYRPITPSCERILQRFSAGAQGLADELPAPRHLVAALLAEESLGAQRLKDLGITSSNVLSGRNEKQPSTSAESPEDFPPLETAFASPPDFSGKALASAWCHPIVERAFAIARRTHGADEVSSEHLLQAMVEIDGPVRNILVSVGVDTTTVLEQLHGQDSSEGSPQALKVDFELILEPTSLPQTPPSVRMSAAPIELETPTAGPSELSGRPTDDVPPRVLAIVDANLNRAREGLRVLEDFARFVHRDKDVTCELKQLRHSLVACECELRREISDLMGHRNTTADVGTGITTAGESRRQSLTDVVVANARRIQESLRSLEEFGKLLSPRFAMQVKQLRYASYDLEQRLTVETAGGPQGGVDSREQRMSRLESAQLYVLITEANCCLNWRDVVEKSLAGGADVVQLREKSLSHDEIVRRGKWISAACKAHNALFILNDQCELAVAACADGVHIGQEDAMVAEARRVLDVSMLLGVSTHNISQLLHACGQDVDYLG
ncbi:MAG: thiamine phosphate synthase, partial [Fuerstiella sp.]